MQRHRWYNPAGRFAGGTNGVAFVNELWREIRSGHKRIKDDNRQHTVGRPYTEDDVHMHETAAQQRREAEAALNERRRRHGEMDRGTSP